jgi:predicted dehydrogenase
MASPSEPEPLRALLVSKGPSATRTAFERALDGFEEPVELVVSPQVPPDLAGAGAVVLDCSAGVESAEEVRSLRSAVEAGLPALILVSRPAGREHPLFWELAGVRPLGVEPNAEWYLKATFPGDEMTRRLPEEFVASGSIVRLDLSPESAPLLKVSIGFRDHIVAARHDVGRGRVVTVGAGGEDEWGFGEELARLIHRALVRKPLASSGRTFGLGIVGYGPYGGMGLYHGMAARATDGIELVAACDSDPGRLKAAEEQFPGLRTSVSADDLAADEDVAVVVVATPPVTHCSLALGMLRAGKHVVLEKPMCLSLAEADELIEAATRHGSSLTVHQSRRFDADFLALRRIVERGDLGELFNVETFVGGFEHPCRAWHSEVAISGGAVYDWGSHHLDWILQLLDGFPTSLVAHGHKRVWRDVTNLDQVRVRLTWDDGREAEFVQSDVSGIRRPKFFLQGTRGTLAGWYRPLVLERLEPGFGYVGERSHHAEAPVELELARYENEFGLTETRIPPSSVAPYAFHRNLADHLQFGEPLAVTADSARRVVALLEAAQRSTDLGNVAVELPKL